MSLKTGHAGIPIAELYTRAIAAGIAKDPRTLPEIRRVLGGARRELRKARGTTRAAFDHERLRNPYADTRILYGDPATEVKTVMVGIDMEAPEIIAADRLRERGTAVDLVLAHHPEGVAWAGLHDVMRLQIAMLKKFGVDEKVGERLLKDRMGEVERSVAPANHARSVDIARLLDIPFMCIHTPADNQVAHYLQTLFDHRKPAKLADVVAMLLAIPEYAAAAKGLAGPRIIAGEPKRRAGRIFVDMTGGTEGPKKIYPRLSQAGVDTIVAMHLSDEHYRRAKDEEIGVVIAGHIASDTLGMNLLLDRIAKRERLEIISCSGFTRVRR